MTLPSFPDVSVSLEENVATVEISAGPMNFLSVPLLEHLVAVWRWADMEPDCRAIMLCSAGSIFSAGANPADFAGAGAGASPAPLYALARRLFEGRKPVIAAIQGAAVGAGLGLALVADQRVAGPGAKFVGNFVQLGFHPGFALSVTLPGVIGAQRAGAMLMSAERVGPDEAYRIGLVDECAGGEALHDAARTRARAIARNAPIAIQDLRATLRRPLLAAVADALGRELEIQLQHIRTKDFSEGISALLNRRPPAFVNG